MIQQTISAHFKCLQKQRLIISYLDWRQMNKREKTNERTNNLPIE